MSNLVEVSVIVFLLVFSLALLSAYVHRIISLFRGNGGAEEVKKGGAE